MTDLSESGLHRVKRSAMKDLDDRLTEVSRDSLPSYITDEHRIKLMQVAINQALKEWANERVTEFGRWSLRKLWFGLIAAALYFIITHSGWELPK